MTIRQPASRQGANARNDEEVPCPWCSRYPCFEATSFAWSPLRWTTPQICRPPQKRTARRSATHGSRADLKSADTSNDSSSRPNRAGSHLLRRSGSPTIVPWVAPHSGTRGHGPDAPATHVQWRSAGHGWRRRLRARASTPRQNCCIWGMHSSNSVWPGSTSRRTLGTFALGGLSRHWVRRSKAFCGSRRRHGRRVRKASSGIRAMYSFIDLEWPDCATALRRRVDSFKNAYASAALFPARGDTLSATTTARFRGPTDPSERRSTRLVRTERSDPVVSGVETVRAGR